MKAQQAKRQIKSRRWLLSGPSLEYDISGGSALPNLGISGDDMMSLNWGSEVLLGAGVIRVGAFQAELLGNSKIGLKVWHDHLYLGKREMVRERSTTSCIWLRCIVTDGIMSV
jgi:hypothetical protein